MKKPSSPAPESRILLIGWDAADWQVINSLVDGGLMPSLEGLINKGTIGNLASLSPMLSPLLWTSIATGKRCYAHGVSGFVEPLPDRSGLRPVGTHSRKCKALWNIVSQNERPSIVCAWQASHPAEPVRGAMVSNLFTVPSVNSTPEAWPVPDGSVEPPSLAQNLADLRVHPAEIEGSLLQQLIPRANELDLANANVQRGLTFLAEKLAEVINVHSVATELLENQPWDFGAVYYECIDQVGHAFMPFHPPRLPEISESDFEFYKDVMTGIYRFHDLMLGRLLELAGPETHVMLVSDHGFQSGKQRPRAVVEPAQWHRPQGIFVLHGPGIRADERIEGATLLDIAPTALTLLGLPVGDDMEGKVLVNAFTETPPITRIGSWETVPGNDGRMPVSSERNDPEAAQAVMHQLAALGYIDPPNEDSTRAISQAEAEADFNRAASLMEAGRAAEAKELFGALTAKHPDEPRYWHAFAQTLFALQMPGGVRTALNALERLEPKRPQTIVLRGMLAWIDGDMKACAHAFEEAERISPNDPVTLTYLGRLYLRQRQWAKAEEMFTRVLDIDPDSPDAHYGLSVAFPRQNFVEKGVDHALLAVGLRHEFPEAHFQLGAILSRLGWFERAVQAFEMSLRLRPGFLLAHRYLSMIYGRIGRSDLALKHQAEVGRLRKMHVPQPIPD
jgi:predicted AlkP superfamily phosphohydrolase/phosphomutase/tetratricopeptide (TPR) repeat protein